MGIAGVKLEFYPNGRGRVQDSPDDRTLPEITSPRHAPTEHSRRRGGGAGAELGTCTLGICCPMGIRLQYKLSIGRTQRLDSCYVEWTPVYTDVRVRWKDEVDQDDNLVICVTAARVNNKRMNIQGETVCIQTE